MLTYEKLSTEKYWIKSVKKEIRAYRNQRSMDAIRSLFQFLFAAGMILFVFFAVETMPTWLPAVTDYVTFDVERINNFMQHQSTGVTVTTPS